MPTKPSLFIIESFSFEEERQGLIEGNILSQILNLCGVNSDYYFIRTEKELIEVIKIFKASTHRYLHISCHGNDDLIGLALENLRFTRFGDIVAPSLKGRRLFLSACKAVNRNLANQVLGEGCFSIVGPKGSVRFSDAAIMWASFYHMLFRSLEKENKTGIKQSDIEHLLGEVVDTFEHPMRFYYPNQNHTQFYRKEFLPLKEPKRSEAFSFR